MSIIDHDLVKRLKKRADIVFAWSRYEEGKGNTPPADALGYDSTARLLLEAAERIERHDRTS